MTTFSGKYPTRILYIFLAAALTLAGAACNRDEVNQTDPQLLSGDERYLVDAYVEIIRASDYFPLEPTVAESLFTVLDSTIDSVRIANTIRTVDQEPERWATIFEEIEREIREDAEKPQFKKPDSAPDGSK